MSVTYSECVSVTLVIQHAKCMCHGMLSYADLQHFLHCVINGTIFRKNKVIEHKILL